MIQCDVVWEPGVSRQFARGWLVLNGQIVEDSRAYQGHGMMPSVSVYDATAITLLTQCRLSEIAEYLDDLTTPLSEAPSEHFKKVRIIYREHDGTKTLQLYFEFGIERVEYWAKPWSIADLAHTMEMVVEDRNVPGLYYVQPREDILDPGWGLGVHLRTPEETVQQALQHWLPIIKDVCEEAETILSTSTRKEALVALFRFAQRSRRPVSSIFSTSSSFCKTLASQRLRTYKNRHGVYCSR